MQMSRVLAFLSLLLAPMLVWAEFGGKTEVELLGYEKTDRKIYYLVHDRSSFAQPPQLYYFWLKRKKNLQQPIKVRTWYQGSVDEVRRTLPKKLAKLKRRLKPLRLNRFPRDYYSKANEKSLGTMEVADVQKDHFQLDVDIRFGRKRGRVSVHAVCNAKSSLGKVYDLTKGRDRGLAVAILNYTGSPREGCYQVEQPVLLRERWTRKAKHSEVHDPFPKK